MTGMQDELGPRLRPDWVDGDIDGLRALATALGDLAAEVGATGDRQAAQLIGLTAGIVDGLAVELAMIETALEEAAHAASRYGVAIGTDGRPPPVSAGPAVDVSAANEQHWALAYRRAYERAMAAAQQARRHAASQVISLRARIEPSSARLVRAAVEEGGWDI